MMVLMFLAFILGVASLGLENSIGFGFHLIGSGIWSAFFGWLAAGFGLLTFKTDGKKSRTFCIVSLVFVSSIKRSLITTHYKS